MTGKQRLLALDVFRGLTVFLMIVVNTQGSGAVPYSQLMHAEWDGCTMTDLVFPSFLFAMGNAMVFSLGSPAKIGRRVVLIFLIGYLLAWYPFKGVGIADTRIMSVLQRIALAYGLAALIVRSLSWRSVVVTAVLLLIGYWWLLYLTGDSGLEYTLDGNGVRKFDLLVLGVRHMYKVRGIAFDPEGLMSTIPAVVNVLAGWLAGKWIITNGQNAKTVRGMTIAGLLLGLLGLLWSIALPLNKQLWTSSYVCYAVGIDLLVLALIFYWKRGTYFFIVFGRNPLFIYIFSNLIGVFLVVRVQGQVFIDWICDRVFQRMAPGPMGDLLFSLAFAMVCWLAGWIMDRKKIYIRI